jgi:signal peptidase I
VGISQPTEKDYIKRVIGLPGDHVMCCDSEGRVVVNGHPINESYVDPAYIQQMKNDPPENCRPCRFDEVVPAGQLWMMGDHRSISLDSRFQGPIPIDAVIGRAFVIVWPKDRWNPLLVPPELAAVPDPVALPSAGGGVPLTGREAPPVRRESDVPGRDGTAEAVVGLPILSSLVISARSGRKLGRRGRRLPS